MKFNFAWKAFVLSAGMVVSGVSSASTDDFTGFWRNVDNRTRGITKLVIKRSGEGVNVHAWGQCDPQDCDWGVAQGVAYAPSVDADVDRTARAVTVVFKERFKDTTLVLHAKGNSLSVQAFTRFTRNSNRSDYTETYRFEKTSGRKEFGDHDRDRDRNRDRDWIGKEDCIPFDYNRARVQLVNNRWKITVDNMFLLDFDNKQDEAKKALRVIRRLRMNKQCFVGRPHPSFEYYLSNNGAPSGSIPGEDCLRFNPGNIRVDYIKNRWKIVDGNHWMFDFGDKEHEARKSFALIQKYRFSESCYVGRPGPSMSYLKR